jgi:hypothetical protein
MMHNDISKEKLTHGNKTKFDNPLLALMKTSTMFIGEFDFDDLKMRGGDVSVTISYIFLLVFMFLMVIVLMNVLNGLAVTDTGKMVAESMIESQISIIDNIRYFENVYLHLGRMECLQCLNNNFLLRKFVLEHMGPRKVSIFDSKYVEEKKLCFPLNDARSENQSNRSTFVRCLNSSDKSKKDKCTKFIKWATGGDENYAAEAFLTKSREILMDLFSSNIRKRRQIRLINEVTKMKGKDNMDDKFIHIENILQRSFYVHSSDNNTKMGVSMEQLLNQ